MTPLEETIAAQRAAADPGVSAFVFANAGAGKTRVLTDRVARLLLTGAPPSKILCITFTKAAAAEMAERLFKLLGGWALLGDFALQKSLSELEGDARIRNTETLASARRLFARALETPGGLRIQTIHSFCESVLKRFPLEAGVAPGFSVLEEADARRLARAALSEMAAASATSTTLSAALARLGVRFEPARLQELLSSRVASRQMFAPMLARAGWDGLSAAVADALGVAQGRTEALIILDASSAISNADMRRLRAALLAGGTTATELAEGPGAAVLAATDPEQRFAALGAFFLTKEGTLRAKLLDKPAKASDPGAEILGATAQKRFVALYAEQKAARILADTTAFLDLLRASLSAYDSLKAARAALDYDDLIARASALFETRESTQWALYKLDQGLDHMLLDEAQDTSPAQWDVVEGPLREFFAGAGARDGERTFFAVGDQKQSIYSFQGADASLFKEKRTEIGPIAAAAGRFVDAPLRHSFRSTAPVLSFVDALFADPDARAGLDDAPLLHTVKREDDAGIVELWPLVPRAKTEDAAAWDAPLDSIGEDSPARTLARAVAATVAGWIATAEPLASAGRPIRADDVLILVQSRGSLFHETIRALGEAGAPVAGADRLLLLQDAGVEDILSYAEFVLLETDDLALAETLKSPFVGLVDDDLFALTRERTGSLWRRFVARADENPLWARARDDIRRARRIALREGAYAFLSHILETGAPSGRTRLYARLGESSREAIDELLRHALDYELRHPRSLQGFLAAVRAGAGEIKREMDQASGAVRVMTVHGAKGLEAPIVFLLDAHKIPDARKIGPMIELAPTPAPYPRGLFALVGAKGDDCAATALARDRELRLQYEEYRRKLYVAATRARDRLYICGLEHGNIKDPGARAVGVKSWRALASDALKRLAGVQTSQHPAGWGDSLRLESPQKNPPASCDRLAVRPTEPPPAFLFTAAPTERPLARLAPSHLADDGDATDEPASFSPFRAGAPFLRGRTLHRLLELLPGVAPASRASSADRLLARLAPEVDGPERARWREEVLAVLANPEFADVFSPGSRAEVRIAGAPKGAKAGMFVSGSIDRLAVTGGRVLIVDYKTNRPPPKRVEETSDAYVGQLAAYRALIEEIYPGHKFDCALLWTYEARLMPVPASMLDHAFKRLLA